MTYVDLYNMLVADTSISIMCAMYVHVYVCVAWMHVLDVYAQLALKGVCLWFRF